MMEYLVQMTLADSGRPRGAVDRKRAVGGGGPRAARRGQLDRERDAFEGGRRALDDPARRARPLARVMSTALASIRDQPA